ncbi:hypothetical protein MTP99_012026 [Tenebrio molitor]|jgi:hypothetical protein|nr:hypothetical protein MTP99_012026 [Tenebrio molitor]
MSSGSAIKGPDNEKKSQFSLTSYCRKHILSPPCRGHQKRDVLSRLGEDYRLSALENDFSGVDRSGDFGAILKSPTLLGELLRKAVEASTEYDSDNGNYLN